MARRVWLVLLVWALIAVACGDDEGATTTTTTGVTAATTIGTRSSTSAAPSDDSDVATKWDLWSSSETLLRGANIWQSVVVPELDGDTFKGSGRVGPPFTQADFDALAAAGANYVSLSVPGLFTEEPPFRVDEGVVENLDRLIEMAGNADLFATISVRTGPGRSEYYICCDGEPEFDGYYLDTVWEDAEARRAWADMWRFTAERYANDPIVVGYKLMVEPNSNAVYFDVYQPDEFYPDQADTGYDWNAWYPDLVAAIREVDEQTPILAPALGFSAISWLPYLDQVDDERLVLVVHQYEPQEAFTHQEDSAPNGYPGTYDVDYDGEPDVFNAEWIDSVLMAPLDEVASTSDHPISVDEFGVVRWVPGAAEYMTDLMAAFEDRGLNHALWEWQTSWPEFHDEVNSFDFRLGPDPANLTDVDNDLFDAIVADWSQNWVRPSTVEWTES